MFKEAKTHPLKKAHELKYTALDPAVVEEMKSLFQEAPWQQATMPAFSTMKLLWSQVWPEPKSTIFFSPFFIF